MRVPVYESGGHWAQALSLALAAHLAIAALFVDLPGWRRAADQGPSAPVQVQVTGLAVETASLAPATLTEAVPVQPQLLPPAEAAQPAVAGAFAGEQAVTVPPVAVIAPGEVAGVATSPVAAGAPAPAAQDGTGDVAGMQPSGPTDARQAQAVESLIAAIRGRLAQSCLIAVPATAPDGAVELTVIGAGDQDIAGFGQDIAAQAQGVALLERSILLDARQCPALAYARASASYPVGAVAISLAQPVVGSGDSLRGSVSGQAVLVLVDDNGVVQDLTRFSAAQDGGGAMQFDVPVRRNGSARDTSQIVMALTGPGMAEAVAQNAGQTAERFFAALGPQPGPGVQVAVAGFYLR
ncbi:MAG: hypothetical protein Q4G14_06885 [Paracoccus sp. (in: a-proteobacteria)]|uniref:hypothetical protein n=1 Tax=Paracoccus sp. TaxID=267 RepID=UPI0026E108B6|nr:hypothetical protein [Paracoccus sp. (in: a-proteobacteria)]MDO5612952.1 hypothetical protein [Paracoccus sp. (in: a-proteobacteria)]